MVPQIRRRRTLEAIKRILLRESINQPLMVIFEDLHWIDSETQALLDLLVDAIANARFLLLVNYRPEYRHEWGSRTHYTQLRLDPLGRESAEEMLSALLGDAKDLIAVKHVIIERTQGTPFFMEEMVQALYEEGVLQRNGTVKLAQPISAIKIPPTVQAVLASRIDRLAPADKELLQTLAVLGREFSLNLVQRVSTKSSNKLEQVLSHLQLSEFSNEQPAVNDIEYSFKHALTQEVAYNSVLSERRKLLHERAGAAMEALYGNRLEDHLSDLARHSERSGNTVKAIEYLGRGGHQAISHASHAEAITFFASALELLKRLPKSPERLKKELTLQLGLGSALQPVKGFSSPEVGQTFSRAFELCQQIEATPELFQVILGLTNFYYMRLELSRAHELAEHLVAISQRDGNAVSLIAAHMTRGVGLLTQGNFTLARDHFECAASFVSSAHRSIYGPAALCWHGAISGYLGYLDQALDQNCAALALARELSDPFTYINALHSAQLVHQLRGEWEASLALADDTLRLSTEHGFQQYSALAMSYRGRALTQLNHAEEGLAALQQGLTAMRSSGMHLLTLSYAMLAEGCAKAGYTADGLSVAAEELESSDRTGDVGWKAELYRIRGDLLLIEGKPTSVNEAEACFRQAIEIAEHQQAKWWELRATLSLARLLAYQGKRDEARAVLAEIYDWFTESFDTADLKEAKILLDELSC